MASSVQDAGARDARESDVSTGAPTDSSSSDRGGVADAAPDTPGDSGATDTGVSMLDASMGDASVDAPADVITEEAAPYDAGPGWQVGDASAPVDTETDGGLPSVECLGLVTKKLVVDPTRSVLYASVPASAPLFPNTVVRIDPTSLAVTGAVSVGSNPNVLAMSDDGASLYVGDDGTGTVCRVDLASGGVYDSVSLGTGMFGNPKTAGDIRAVPGSATNWVVSERDPDLDPAYSGLVLYDRATLLGQLTYGGPIVDSIAFTGPTVLYGYDNEDTGDYLYELVVGPTAITLLGPHEFVITQAFGVDITSQGGWLFATDGQAVDGTTAKSVGRYTATGPIWPDPNGTDVWVMETGNVSSTLFDFDRSTFATKRAFALPFVPYSSDSPISLVGWSSTGLAFNTSSTVCIVTVP